MPAKKRTFRGQCLVYVAKMCAYKDLGKYCEARQYAEMLKLYLIENGLLVDTAQRGGDNGQQSHNGNKS